MTTEGIEAVFLVGMDLPDQDQRVAHQDAGEPNQRQDGVEAEGLMKQEQGRDGTRELRRRSRAWTPCRAR